MKKTFSVDVERLKKEMEYRNYSERRLRQQTRRLEIFFGEQLQLGNIADSRSLLSVRAIDNSVITIVTSFDSNLKRF